MVTFVAITGVAGSFGNGISQCYSSSFCSWCSLCHGEWRIHSRWRHPVIDNEKNITYQIRQNKLLKAGKQRWQRRGFGGVSFARGGTARHSWPTVAMAKRPMDPCQFERLLGEMAQVDQNFIISNILFDLLK